MQKIGSALRNVRLIGRNVVIAAYVLRKASSKFSISFSSRVYSMCRMVPGNQCVQRQSMTSSQTSAVQTQEAEPRIVKSADRKRAENLTDNSGLDRTHCDSALD